MPRLLDGAIGVSGITVVVLLTWQAIALARGVTFGPGEPFLVAPLPDVFSVVVTVLCGVPATVWMARKVHGRAGALDATSVAQLSVGLAVLALSYRLLALALLALAVGARFLHGPRWRASAWALWTLALVASLLPVDVTLRRTTRATGVAIVPAINCEAATEETVRAVLEGSEVCIANGVMLYNAPSQAVVW